MTLRVRLLVAGNSVQRQRLALRTGGWQRIRFPATVALIEHPEHGAALFDTGYAPRFLDASHALPQRLYRWLVPVEFEAADAVVAQLGQLGLGPQQVRTVILSHLHGDHISGLRDFPAARIVWSAATDLSGATPGEPGSLSIALRTTRRGFLPVLLPPDLPERLQAMESLPVVATGLPGFEAGHDLFGDGSAVLVPLPGHAPGHVGLWLPRTQGPSLFLVGDACWLAEAFLAGDLPPAWVLASMGGKDSYTETVDRLAHLASARPDVLIVPSHCAASVAAATLALARG
jgi:glyoxylase-like metal-dependent hydrolase (beta-lactamase superfamily II)